jgi:peptidoglycan/LPS O-acetylase OafA/YrhL
MSDTVNLSRSKEQDSQRLLHGLALIIASLAALKFFAIMAIVGPMQSPWLFLAITVVPFLIGGRLLASHPRAGAIVIAVFAGLFATLCGIAIATGIEPSWADYLMVFVCGPLSLAAIGVAVRVVQKR